MNILTTSHCVHCNIFFTVSSFFSLKDEDPALRELAEMERESCVQDIQDLSNKVEF